MVSALVSKVERCRFQSISEWIIFHVSRTLGLPNRGAPSSAVEIKGILNGGSVILLLTVKLKQLK